MDSRGNLIVITIDCMRADYLSDNTPVMNAFGQRGQVYRWAYANGCGTPSSFPAIFASRLVSAFAHDPNIDADDGYALKPEDLTLAEALNNDGYETVAFVAGNPYLGRRYGYHRGFEIYEDNQPGELVDRITGGRLRGALRRMAHNLPWNPYPSAEKITDTATTWLAERKSGGQQKPFFMWVHYMDAHFPTLPPGRHSLGERQAAWSPIKGEAAKHHDVLVRLYRDALTYVDGQMAKLLAQVDPDTTVAITADHGQLLGEHQSYWHYGVWEQLLRVPLIVVGPSAPQGEVNDLVQLLDFSPHLLRLIGVEPPDNWQGAELRTPGAPIYAVSNNPEHHTYIEASIGIKNKVVRTPDAQWEYERTTEPPAMVLD